MKIQTAHSHHTHRASGPGGSHVGMFGRSTIFLAPEGDPPPTGGTGSAPPPSETPPGTAPAGDPPKVFTQEQVNAYAARAREEGRQAALKAQQQPPAPPPKPTTPAEELAQLRTQNEELALRISFDKRAARLGLGDEASDELFELYRVQKPTDPGAWFEKKSKVFGLTNATASGSTNPDPSATNPAAPTVPPISNKGSPAPGDTRDIDHVVTDNPFGASRVEFDRLVAKHGEAKARRLLMEAGQRKAGNIKVTI